MRRDRLIIREQILLTSGGVEWPPGKGKNDPTGGVPNERGYMSCKADRNGLLPADREPK